MPLEIVYRPVVLPPVPAPPRAVGTHPPRMDGSAASPAAPAPPRPLDPAEPRPRDFVARIRRRDMISLRRALHRPARARQRIAGIVAIGLLPALLAILGWGDPRGIAGASAQDRALASHAPMPASNASATTASTPPASAWDRALAGLHGDGDLPQVPAALVPLPSPSVAAARPLAATGSGLDHVRALQCLTAAIYYEAAREPDDGQRAVAQVVLNRVAHPAFPKTVCGVVYQGSERAGCQFSFACDGALARAPMAAYWDRARRVAAAALAGSVYAPIGLSTHYHTGAVHPAWSDSMILQATIGAHQFYRWTGNAGQPRAFSAVYSGGEPIAAPHPRTWVSTGADFADPLVLAQAFEAGRLAALRRAVATAPMAGIDPAIARVGAGFGQQPLPHAVSMPDPGAHSDRAPDATAASRILPGSGAVRPDATQQYDSAAHWIHQPGA